MARNENPPFQRGETFYNGGTIDTNNLGGIAFEGKEYVFEDGIYGTGNPVTVRVVRNKSAGAILPGRLVTMQSGTFYGRRVDGYATTTAQESFVVDELLPAAGVPVNDLFYVILRGPTLVKTDLAAGANNLIPANTMLVALTAATSGATTAGRVAPQDLTGATQNLANQIQNRVGRAMSAATTAQTNSDLLVHVNRW